MRGTKQRIRQPRPQMKMDNHQGKIAGEGFKREMKRQKDALLATLGAQIDGLNSSSHPPPGVETRLRGNNKKSRRRKTTK